MGADRKANAQGPVRGSCGLLELLQRDVALEALGKSESSLRAEAVVAQTASMGAEVGAEACQGALTQKQTLWSWFECRAAYFSDCNVVLPLSPSARAAPPSEPRLLFQRLRAWGQGRVLRAVNGH